jgi:hypothetical protein
MHRKKQDIAIHSFVDCIRLIWRPHFAAIRFNDLGLPPKNLGERMLRELLWRQEYLNDRAGS